MRDPAKAVSLEREGILAVAGDLTDADVAHDAPQTAATLFITLPRFTARQSILTSTFIRRINVGGTKNGADAVER